MNPKNERLELRLDQKTLDQIDDWRNAQSGLPSRSEAVRKLIAAGIGRPGDAQLYQLARFNVLCAARTPGLQDSIDEAYVYAWQVGVYPFFNDNTALHVPFADQFSVSSDMVDELSGFLEDRADAEDVPTFYELEDHYQVRRSRSPWGRMELIHACRYMFLKQMWDEAFWKALLKGSDHPSEAKAIVREFKRDAIYIC